MLHLLRAEYLHKLSVILLNMILSITLYLFIIYLLIVIHGYLFYTFGYNPILHPCFPGQIVSALEIGSSFCWLMCTLFFLSFFFFFSSFLFSALNIICEYIEKHFK